MDFFIYLFGALGIGANILIYQQKTGQRLIAYKLISDVLWALHYFFLGAYSGIVVAVIAALREFVYLFKEKKWASFRGMPIVFMLISIGLGIWAWGGYASLLTIAASLIAIGGFWKKSPRLSRILAFPIAISLLTYDILCGSYLGIINECVSMISATVGIIRYSGQINRMQPLK